jgi:DNA-binding MarR family transcriptional regulator
MKRTDPNIYQSLAAFRLALRRFLAFSRAASSAAGVTPEQYQVMLVIKADASGAVMMRDLAEQMLLKPHGAVQMVDRLVGNGLVERHDSPTDGRIVLVSLTAKGSAVLEQLASQHAVALLEHQPLLVETLKQLRELGRGQRNEAAD